MKFLIITPAKNEAEYIEGLIESMMQQDLLPQRWVIVDDGSTDGMPEIVERYAAELPWLTLIRKSNSTEARSGGSKVVRAFNEGYSRYEQEPHDVVMKLDADLILPSDYLSSLREAFEADTQLGLCGGYCVIPIDGGWEPEAAMADHVRGALKAYRKDCFFEIGGLTETWNWDGIDGMQAMHKGWNVKTIEKAVKHLRPTSAAYEPLQHAYRSGEEAYRTGSDLGLAIIRAAFKVKVKPLFKNSIQYLKGYWGARKRKEPKVVDASLQQFIRRHTYRRIISLNR